LTLFVVNTNFAMLCILMYEVIGATCNDSSLNRRLIKLPGTKSDFVHKAKIVHSHDGRDFYFI